MLLHDRFVDLKGRLAGARSPSVLLRDEPIRSDEAVRLGKGCDEAEEAPGEAGFADTQADWHTM